MGQGYSKQEEKEVVITQNAVGSNDATGTSEHHTKVNNILISVLFVVLALIGCCVLYKFFKKAQQKYIHKEVRREVWARLQARLSMRKSVPAKDDEEEGA